MIKKIIRLKFHIPQFLIDEISSKIFYVNPKYIKHDIRNKENCWSNRIEDIDTGLPMLSLNASDEERWNRWDALKSEISRKGFDDKHPILIHLDSDNIIDGNHRLAIANELKLDYVPVRFEYIIYN